MGKMDLEFEKIQIQAQWTFHIETCDTWIQTIHSFHQYTPYKTDSLDRSLDSRP